MNRTPIILALLLALTPACIGGEDDGPSGVRTESTQDPGGKYGTSTPENLNGGACEDGAEKECIVYLGEHGDTKNCFYGYQDCIDGTWSDCGE